MSAPQKQTLTNKYASLQLLEDGDNDQSCESALKRPKKAHDAITPTPPQNKSAFQTKVYPVVRSPIDD